MNPQIIKNREEIVSHGNCKGREITVDIIERAIMAVNGYELTKKAVYIRDNKLIIKDLVYDLSRLRNIYVIGAGKATFSITQALDEILGENISRGLIIVKDDETMKLRNIEVVRASHPMPNEDGLEGARRVLEIARMARDGDLIFCLITGGASALMPMPAGIGISLEDLIRVTELLLSCGATIEEINCVRNHIELLKGGKLLRYIHPGAEVIGLIIVDEVAGLPWGPTVPDTTTFADAISVLKRYDLLEKTPPSIIKHLRRGLKDPSLENPRPEEFRDRRVHNIVLADNRIMCEAAKERAEELGLKSLIFTTVLEGESRDAGIVLASIAKEVERRGQPISPPCALIAGGETTVTLSGECGKGGPSQELVVAAALKIAGSKLITVASIDTDGTDGPTDAAGGIVDGYTLERARREGIDLFECLKRHNCYEALKALGDAIITKQTGTNVMDLNVLVIAE